MRNLQPLSPTQFSALRRPQLQMRSSPHIVKPHSELIQVRPIFTLILLDLQTIFTIYFLRIWAIGFAESLIIHLLTPQPDKAPDHLKENAHTQFQEIAFAYAVLSDPIRRKRYDSTGSTAESIAVGDDFCWSEFYREQFADVVTSEAIEKFSKSYKGSPEEKDDVLEAYRKSEGKWTGIYETIMLSDPLVDEDRFREIIDEAIKNKDVPDYPAYSKESKKSKDARMKEARQEGAEAMAYAEELGVADKLFGKKGSKGGKKKSSEDGLAALIRGKQSKSSSFLDHLEQKYGGEAKSKGKKGKKRASEEVEEEEPSEEAFQAAAARLKAGKTGVESSNGRKAKKAKR